MPYTLDAEHDGQIYRVQLDKLRVPRCRNCGEMVFDDAANEQISDALRQQVGLLSPAEIRANREALGLTQRQLADHLGIAEATLSRWERSGQIQERALDRLVRVYFAFPGVRAALADEAALAALGSQVGRQEEAPLQPPPPMAGLAEVLGELPTRK